MRTILVTIAASLLAGLVAHVVDQLLGLESLTRNGAAPGSLLRLLVLGLIMVPIIAGVMLGRAGARRPGRAGRGAPPVRAGAPG